MTATNNSQAIIDICISHHKALKEISSGLYNIYKSEMVEYEKNTGKERKVFI